MNPQDEKFFETLAGARQDGPQSPEYEVELTKAGTGALTERTRSFARPKAETKEEWSDAEPEGQLTVDVYQTQAEIVVESAIAGVRPEDIDINVTPDSISIRGSRHRDMHVEGKEYLYQECYWGRFARSIILPQEVDPERAEVTFKNGILTIHLPKVNKKRTKKLQVRVD